VTRGLAKASGVGLNWDDDDDGGGGGAQFAMIEHSGWEVVTSSYSPGCGKGNDQNSASRQPGDSAKGRSRHNKELKLNWRCSMPAPRSYKDSPRCRKCSYV